MWWIFPAALGPVIIGVGTVRAVRGRFLVVTVVGESMQPNYETGDRVIVRRTRLDDVACGDVVVIEEPDADGGWTRPAHRGATSGRDWMIKRVVAVPGDPRPDEHLPAAVTPEASVPAGAFVVRGDNADRSYDSRQLGYFPANRLLGVVLRTVGG